MTEPSSIGRTRVAGVEVSTAHWIDGRRVPSNRTFEVFYADRRQPSGHVSAGAADEADAAVAAARRAFPAWAALGPAGRLPILKRFAEGILARKEEIAAVETAVSAAASTASR